MNDPWDDYLSACVASASERYIVIEDADGDAGIWDTKNGAWVDTHGDIYDWDDTEKLCRSLNDGN